jgi:transmembrane sensor
VEVSSLCHREKRRFTAGERVSMRCKNTPSGMVAPEPSPAPTSSTREPPLVPSASTVGARSSLGLSSPLAASNPEPFKPMPSAQPASVASTVFPAPLASAEVPEPSWKELAAARRYREAMAAANTRGFDELCNTLDAGDLSLLGDVARFSGDTGRARQALTTLRRRFPGDARSAASAFTLGRIAFDQQHSYGDAAGWFSTYLNEQPSGPFAQEALGRLIEARQRSGDLEGARHAAQQYLLRFPGGAHEPFARKLTAP